MNRISPRCGGQSRSSLAFGLVAAACGADSSTSSGSGNGTSSTTKPAPPLAAATLDWVRLDVPAGVLRDGDPGVQDGAAGGHGDLRRRRLGQGPDRPAGGPRPVGRLRQHGRSPRTCRSTRARSSTSRRSAAPITVSYNLSGGRRSSSSRPRRWRKIFQGKITTWNDAAIKADNPKRHPAAHRDHRGAPRRRLGHDGELHRST